MNLNKLIEQLKDPSPQVKLKCLKEMDTISDFSTYSNELLLELNEALSEYREYFNPSVQMFALRVHDKVSKILTEKMKASPESIAKEAALSLLDGIEDEEKKIVKKPAKERPNRIKKQNHSSSPVKKEENIVVDFSVVDEKKKENVDKKETPVRDIKKEKSNSNSEPIPPQKEKQSSIKKDIKVKKPQMIIVYSEEERKLAKFGNITLSLIIFILTLLVSYKEIINQTNIGYGALGFAIFFTIVLFTPSRHFPTYNKLRIATTGFVAITGYIYYKYGFSYNFELINYVPSEFHFNTFFKNLNLNITKFILLSWLLLPTFLIIIDDTPTAGTKMFITFLFLYSSVSIIESLYFKGSLNSLMNDNGFFNIINPPFIRPFLFGINLFYPLLLIIAIFSMLQHLFSLNFKKLISSFLLGTMVIISGTVLLYHLRISPYPNIADFFIPRTLETYKDNISTGIYNSIIAAPNIEEKLLDMLAVENGKFIQGNGNNGSQEIKIEPEILIPDNGIEPSLSRNGLYLAFAQTDGKKSDIKFMRLQSREIIPLISDNSNNRYPVFSPDSSKIAFISDSDGQDNVYIINTNGRNLKQLTATSGKKSNLSWAGRNIVYESDGKIIKYPVPLTRRSKHVSLKSKVKLYSKIASKLLGKKIVANISSIEGNGITISFNTSENNEVNIFRDMYSALIIASKLFKDYYSKIKYIEVKTRYLTTTISVKTSPEIIKYHLENREYLTDKKIEIWLKTSTVKKNGKLYLN